MADFVGGIKHIGPSYPIRPVRPVQEDKETDNERKRRQDP